MSTATASKGQPSLGPQKCAYCAGTGRWSKEVIRAGQPESVFCPHCHGSGLGGSTDISGSE